MIQRQGIVLKKFLTSRKIIVLDCQVGATAYIADTDDVCLGTLLQFWVYERKGTLFMRNSERLAVPLELARQDLLFVHHFLELCNHFAPSGYQASELFALMLRMYSLDKKPLCALIKKSFLVKFFWVVGVWPEDQKFHTPGFHQMVSGSIDFIANQGLHLGIEKELDEWIASCLVLHPAIIKFATAHFLDESRVA